MIGTTISHYTILDEVGRGGMGIVYRARDTRLDRVVALKCLPPHLTTSSTDTQRFLREAQAAAALNHPHICTIHSVEAATDPPFITMEYLDGRTLRAILEAGALDPATALAYGIQLAAALAEAHKHGIIHRDMKPGNLMVDAQGQLKVLDFGLAKQAGTTPLTRTGTTVGTMAYMAPEQIRGQPVDHRADLFAVGVLLFEMLTGQRPFQGEYEAALSYAIINDDPPSLTTFWPDAPPTLSQLISRLLAKDPSTRYGTTATLAEDLQACRDALPASDAAPPIDTPPPTPPAAAGDLAPARSTAFTIPVPSLRSRTGRVLVAVVGLVLVVLGYWLWPTTGATGPPDTTLAVLPLESMSPDSADVQFTDGVHEELINRLAGIGELTVIARRSVLRFSPDDRQDLQAIGQQLGVTTLMDGTVRWVGDRLRVTVQLIDVTTLGTVWSGSFDETIDEVFALQSRIARQVAGELQASLTPAEQARLDQPPTADLRAYRLYMQARESLSRSVFTKENLLLAENLLRTAVEADPAFAQAWGMLAYTYGRLYWWHGASPDHLQMLGDAAKRAREYGPDLPETALATGAALFWSTTNAPQTLAHFEAALQQFPNQPWLYMMTAFTHRRLGNWAQMIDYLQQALALDPLNTNLHISLVYNYWLIRDYDQAEVIVDQWLELDPNASVALLYKGFIGLEKEGTLEQWERWWDQVRPADPATEHPWRWGQYNTLNRDWEEALRGYQNVTNQVDYDRLHRYLPRNYLIATILNHQGKYTEARSYFEQARDELERLRDTHPDMPRYRTTLGKVYAHLGEPAKALQEANQVTKLMQPYYNDAEIRPFFETRLAEIYAWAGEADQAIDKLEYLLSVPSRLSRNVLRLDPVWDPLRDHPRFQALLAGEDTPVITGL